MPRASRLSRLDPAAPNCGSADRDGANARQLTNFGRASIRQPRWSPDGTRILISASVNGQLDLYLVDVAGGALTRLTDDGEDEIAPAWSHDGAAVLFGARRSGTWQVMRMTIADRSRTQLTTDGGYAAQASPDGTDHSLHAPRTHGRVDDARRRRRGALARARLFAPLKR